jgi:DNA polymerase-4
MSEGRPLRQILHVDMDAFFASVEQRDDPRLRGKPVLVGGGAKRGVVAAASYEARRFGARSAMPMAEALRRCPKAIVVTPRHGRYAEVSADVFAIFRRYTPLVEGLSLDEAFLDVTASQALFGDGEVVALCIQAAIRDELNLGASAGVAPCRFVAKIASDLKKPNGLVVVRAGEERALLAPLPIERMWGVGPKATERLHAAGIRVIGDLERAGPKRLEELLGTWGPTAFALAQGIDPREVVPTREALSIGAEETVDEDLVGRDAIVVRLLAHSARVAQRLVRAGVSGRVVVVKIKYADFTLRSRRVTLPEPVADTDSIHRAATSLLDRFELAGRAVRLTGVAVEGLEDGPVRSLFPDEAAARRRKLEEVVAKVSDRFGRGGLTRASLLSSPGRDDDAD